MRRGKALKILLALATAVASYFTAVLCAYPFFDSWLDIILAIASWETFGYRLTLATVVNAIVFGAVEGLAVTGLTVSELYVIQQVAEKLVSQPQN
jgi:hypothetical protein